METQCTALDSRNDFEIQLCPTELSAQKGLRELKLSREQKMRISALIQQIPSMTAAETLADAYILSLPEGVSVSDLMHYAEGGIGTPYFGESGIAGHASLHSTKRQGVLLGAFSAMSIATGQYFLSEINASLTAISQKAETILVFLRENQRAELLSETEFVNYACQNYGSIMLDEGQRIATITSLQESRKVARKHMEFYIFELDAYKSKPKLDDVCHSKDALCLSLQTYVMGSVLEAYYARNDDPNYLQYVEKDIFANADRCKNHLLSDLSAIGTKGFPPLKKQDQSDRGDEIETYISRLKDGEELINREALSSVLRARGTRSEFCFTRDGRAYFKS